MKNTFARSRISTPPGGPSAERAGRVFGCRSRIERDGSSGAKGTSALPRPLRGPRTRPACTPACTLPSRPRPQIAAKRRTGRPQKRKRVVSPGLTLRRTGASDARRAKAQRMSERARAWMARSERPEGQPRAHPERPTPRRADATHQRKVRLLQPPRSPAPTACHASNTSAIARRNGLPSPANSWSPALPCEAM